MTGAWWRGTRLVAERGVRDTVRGRGLADGGEGVRGGARGEELRHRDGGRTNRAACSTAATS